MEAHYAQKHDSSNLRKWMSLRWLSISILFVSCALLALSAWVAARLVAIADLFFDPYDASRTLLDRPSGAPSMGAMSSNAALMANQSVSAFNESWHAHLGVWRSSTRLVTDEGTNNWTFSTVWFAEGVPPSDNPDEIEAFKASAILRGIEQAMAGLAPSMALLPTAAALTGLFVGYQLLSMAIYRGWLKPAAGRDGFFTSHAIGLFFCGLCVVSTFLAWTFQIVMMVAAYDSADDLYGLEVTEVKPHGTFLMMCLALGLQLVAFAIQYFLFGSMELSKLEGLSASVSQRASGDKIGARESPVPDMPWSNKDIHQSTTLPAYPEPELPDTKRIEAGLTDESDKKPVGANTALAGEAL